MRAGELERVGVEGHGERGPLDGLAGRMQGLYARLSAMETPTVAAVNG